MCGNTLGGRSTNEVAILTTCHDYFNNQGLEFLSLSLLYSQVAPGPPVDHWVDFLGMNINEILLYAVLLY